MLTLSVWSVCSLMEVARAKCRAPSCCPRHPPVARPVPLPMPDSKIITPTDGGLSSPASPSYSTPGSTAPNRFVGIGTRDNFLNIPQQTQSWFL
ncbi:hypothetical protein CesoFtcFv8_008905 [Champsocephalus esox]|uniref:Secreted protein n=1 Tax=Champsocephalus esox TaxID=159716 RepID=A0AAN8H4L0_9TELE|nr:hypothetical protein CesoFtcFv8_008905 [Champsocephalus esox]